MRAHFANRARAAATRLEPVDLTHSFRSGEAVLRAVDAVFAQDSLRAGVVDDGAVLRHAAVRLGQAGVVELWPPAEPNEAAPTAPWEPPVERRDADGELLGVTWAAVPEEEPPAKDGFRAAVMRFAGPGRSPPRNRLSLLPLT